MTITVLNARNCLDAVNRLIEGKRLPAKLAFRLVRLVGKLEGVVKDASTTEKSIIERYTQRDEDCQPVLATDGEGNPIPDTIMLTDPAAFNEEMAALMEAEVALDTAPIDESDFEGREIEPVDALMVMQRAGLLA
jgi:hypothetical protein